VIKLKVKRNPKEMKFKIMWRNKNKNPMQTKKRKRNQLIKKSRKYQLKKWIPELLKLFIDV
jgi:hypothetical protein